MALRYMSQLCEDDPMCCCVECLEVLSGNNQRNTTEPQYKKRLSQIPPELLEAVNKSKSNLLIPNVFLTTSQTTSMLPQFPAVHSSQESCYGNDNKFAKFKLSNDSMLSVSHRDPEESHGQIHYTQPFAKSERRSVDVRASTQILPNQGQPRQSTPIPNSKQLHDQSQNISPATLNGFPRQQSTDDVCNNGYVHRYRSRFLTRTVELLEKSIYETACEASKKNSTIVDDDDEYCVLGDTEYVKHDRLTVQNCIVSKYTEEEDDIFSQCPSQLKQTLSPADIAQSYNQNRGPPSQPERDLTFLTPNYFLQASNRTSSKIDALEPLKLSTPDIDFSLDSRRSQSTSEAKTQSSTDDDGRPSFVYPKGVVTILRSPESNMPLGTILPYRVPSLVRSGVSLRNQDLVERLRRKRAGYPTIRYSLKSAKNDCELTIETLDQRCSLLLPEYVNEQTVSKIGKLCWEGNMISTAHDQACPSICGQMG